MNCSSELTSSSTPQKSLFFASPTAWLNPVPTGSMKTRSQTSSNDSELSSSLNGGVTIPPTSTEETRLGPNAPMCSQMEDEPGPPLYTKASGRLLISFTSL